MPNICLIGKIPDNKQFGGLYTVKTLYNVTRYNMHWLVFDTINSIKEQDLHMNYFIDASIVYKNVICQTYV